MTAVQRVEVTINGKLHRRPDRDSERCTCGFPDGWLPSTTWIGHLKQIIIDLESKRT